MLENGFVKTYRSLLTWEWYGDANTFRLFMHLLLTVNYENKQWRGIDIKRGQRLTSVNKLATELNLTDRNIRTALKHLISTGEVTSETTNQYTLITVLNYNTYQQVTSEMPNKRQTSDEQVTNDRQTSDNKERKIKKEEERKEEKNISKQVPSAEALEIISYLNLKCGTAYRTDAKETIRLIAARLKENYTVDDIKNVIDLKSSKWLNTDMSQYLRPITLFGSKFEYYYNDYIKEIKKTEPKEHTVKDDNPYGH